MGRVAALPGKSQPPLSPAAGTRSDWPWGKGIKGVGKTGLKDKITKVWESYSPPRKAMCWVPALGGGVGGDSGLSASSDCYYVRGNAHPRWLWFVILKLH